MNTLRLAAANNNFREFTVNASSIQGIAVIESTSTPPTGKTTGRSSDGMVLLNMYYFLHDFSVYLIVIESVLNGNASAGTLSSFIVVLNVLKCYVAETVCEFVNKNVFCSFSFFEMNVIQFVSCENLSHCTLPLVLKLNTVFEMEVR